MGWNASPTVARGRGGSSQTADEKPFCVLEDIPILITWAVDLFLEWIQNIWSKCT